MTYCIKIKSSYQNNKYNLMADSELKYLFPIFAKSVITGVTVNIYLNYRPT